MFYKEDIKKNIIEIGKKLYNSGLSSGISGNISYKQDSKIFITATCTCLGEMDESQIAVIDEEGNILEDNHIKPSSEKMMHLEIYKIRPEINAIIHAHPTFCTTLAVSGEKDFPSILAEPVVMFGEKISVAEYQTPSTNDLAKSVAKYFENSDAALMANHGATVCGHDLKETYYKLETLEFYSRVYLFSGMLDKRAELQPDKIQELLKFRHCK